MQKFLELTNYYQQFVKNFAKIAKPVRESQTLIPITKSIKFVIPAVSQNLLSIVNLIEFITPNLLFLYPNSDYCKYLSNYCLIFSVAIR